MKKRKLKKRLNRQEELLFECRQRVSALEGFAWPKVQYKVQYNPEQPEPYIWTRVNEEANNTNNS